MEKKKDDPISLQWLIGTFIQFNFIEISEFREAFI